MEMEMLRKLWTFRHVVLLLAIAVAVPSTAVGMGAGHGSPPKFGWRALPSQQAGEVIRAAAPADLIVGPIQFARDRDQDLPVNPGDHFRFGPKRIFAFFDYRDADRNERLRWVFRHLDTDTDVNFGDVELRDRDGHVVGTLERQDHDFLMLGRFALIIRTESGRELQRGEFEITEAHENDNHPRHENENNRHENENKRNENENNHHDNNNHHHDNNNHHDDNDNGHHHR